MFDLYKNLLEGIAIKELAEAFLAEGDEDAEDAPFEDGEEQEVVDFEDEDEQVAQKVREMELMTIAKAKRKRSARVNELLNGGNEDVCFCIY